MNVIWESGLFWEWGLFWNDKREIQAQLRQQEEREESARENYNDLQQEVDIKTRKLKKLYNKLQSTKGKFQWQSVVAEFDVRF